MTNGRYLSYIHAVAECYEVQYADIRRSCRRANMFWIVMVRGGEAGAAVCDLFASLSGPYAKLALLIGLTEPMVMPKPAP